MKPNRAKGINQIPEETVSQWGDDTWIFGKGARKRVFQTFRFLINYEKKKIEGGHPKNCKDLELPTKFSIKARVKKQRGKYKVWNDFCL